MVNGSTNQTPAAAIYPTTSGELTSSSATGGKSLGKDEFLKLLVAQLTHQDPLDPTDPTEFVGQLSQMSSLEQLMSMRDGLELMAVAQTAGTSADVVSFVGREITFRGDSLVMDGGGAPSYIGIQLDGKASEVVLTIKDSAGKTVRTLQIGGRDPGKHVVAFDGKDEQGNPLADGEYSVTVSATSHTGETVKVSARTEGVVVAVSYDNGYPELVLDDGRRIALGQVLEVKAASTPVAAGVPDVMTDSTASDEEEGGL